MTEKQSRELLEKAKFLMMERRRRNLDKRLRWMANRVDEICRMLLPASSETASSETVRVVRDEEDWTNLALL